MTQQNQIERNKELFTLITHPQSDEFFVSGGVGTRQDIIEMMLNENNPMLKTIAAGLNFREYGAEFMDAYQTTVLAFIEAINIAVDRGIQDYDEAMIPGITKNLACQNLYKQYRPGGVNASYSTRKRQVNEEDGREKLHVASWENELELYDNELTSEGNFLSHIVREDFRSMINELIETRFDETEKIILDLKLQGLSSREIEEQTGINYKMVQRRYNSIIEQIRVACKINNFGEDVLEDFEG